MKKTILCLIFQWIFLINPILSQFIEVSTPISEDLRDVYFFNEEKGVVVGENGIILRTVDGGANWDVVLEDSTIFFTKVEFFNDLDGIAIGSSIYITDDAGLTWENSPNDNEIFHDIDILNDSTTIVSGAPNILMKSYNYGKNWTTILNDSSTIEIKLISFINNQIGYAASFSNVPKITLKTIDGGYSWNEIEDTMTNSFTELEDIYFIDEQKGFRGGWYSPHLMKTSNSCETWEEIESEIDSNYSNPMAIYDFHIERNSNNSFYACGWYGNIFKSDDGGNKWNALETEIENIRLYSIYFIDSDIGWVVGENGKIYKTNNGGVITNISNIEKEVIVELYPNPTKDKFKIKLSNELLIEKISIFNLKGKEELINKSKDEIDISRLDSGIYFVKVDTNQGAVIEKIAKN